MDTNDTNKSISQMHHYEFQEEWYEDSVDLDLKAFTMTEEEWIEREQDKLNPE